MEPNNMEKNNTLDKESQLKNSKKKIYIGLLFTTGVELVTLLALIGCWYSSRFGQWDARESEMCLPMHKFDMLTNENNSRLCPVVLKEIFNNNTEGTKYCCGPMSVVIMHLTEKIVYKKYDSDAAPEIAALDFNAFNCIENNFVPLKAHLIGITSEKHLDSSKLFWNTGYPSYTDSGMRYLVDNGTLYIEKSGYYYISSQLRSNIQNTNCTNEVKCENFNHFVHKVSKAGTEQVLLEGENPNCNIAAEVSEITSAIGAVFKLEIGDELYVSTSHPDSVLTELSDNYFSIYSV